MLVRTVRWRLRLVRPRSSRPRADPVRLLPPSLAPFKLGRLGPRLHSPTNDDTRDPRRRGALLKVGLRRPGTLSSATPRRRLLVRQREDHTRHLLGTNPLLLQSSSRATSPNMLRPVLAQHSATTSLRASITPRRRRRLGPGTDDLPNPVCRSTGALPRRRATRPPREASSPGRWST